MSWDLPSKSSDHGVQECHSSYSLWPCSSCLAPWNSSEAPCYRTTCHSCVCACLCIWGMEVFVPDNWDLPEWKACYKQRKPNFSSPYWESPQFHKWGHSICSLVPLVHQEVTFHSSRPQERKDMKVRGKLGRNSKTHLNLCDYRALWHFPFPKLCVLPQLCCFL